MEVVILDEAQEIAKKGATLVAELVAKKPHSVLGLATGGTPVQLYKHLIALYQQGQISFNQVQSFNLDEYLGIASSNPLSYRHFMNSCFFEHIDVKLENTHLPDCSPANPREEGPRYEQQIKAAGGIDLQILGIGSNGHIGFNEPSSSLASRTRIKTLAQSTIEDNSKLLKPGEFQPHLAITMGIGTILEARRILLLALGEHKAEAVQAAIEGPVTAMCPASALQLHPHVTVVSDAAAASQLELADYYRWVYRENEELKKEYGNFYELDIYG
ncbi:MAG: glucosamine-6-phosphate deaminase [Pseudomonadales bacterium]